MKKDPRVEKVESYKKMLIELKETLDTIEKHVTRMVKCNPLKRSWIKNNVRGKFYMLKEELQGLRRTIEPIQALTQGGNNKEGQFQEGVFEDLGDRMEKME